MKHRRSIFLINRAFQLRYSFYVCSWLFALSLIYPLIINQLFELFIRYAALDPMGPPIQALKSTRSEMIWLMIFLQILFLCVTFLISIFMSHRIAGPIYKLSMFLSEAAKGNFKGELQFRKRDHFQDLAQSYNHVLHKIRDNMSENVSQVNAASSELEKILNQTSGPVRESITKTLAYLDEIKQQNLQQ